MLRQEVAYLRNRARRIRELAIFETVIARELLRLADDLDSRASQLEKGETPNELPRANAQLRGEQPSREAEAWKSGKGTIPSN